MGTIETLALILHVLAALAIIGLVLIQQGKGADMGSGFGAGASATVFGSGGAGSFLTRLTTAIAIAFFLSSFGLAYFAKQRSEVARDLGVPQLQDYGPLEEEAPEPEIPAFDGAPALGPASDLPTLEAPPASQAPGAEGG